MIVYKRNDYTNYDKKHYAYDISYSKSNDNNNYTSEITHKTISTFHQTCLSFASNLFSRDQFTSVSQQPAKQLVKRVYQVVIAGMIN